MQRCPWAQSELMIAYHDTEWGVPLHDDRGLFEFLILEGAQAGLSWETILKKRPAYRAAFHNFDISKIARYGARDVKRLLADAGIVRNRQKVAAAILNAQATLDVQQEFGSLDRFLWQFAPGEGTSGRPKRGGWVDRKQVPASTAESDALSKELKRRGFKFVGSTICYAFMQAVGMVNDHLADCFRYCAVRKLQERRKP